MTETTSFPEKGYLFSLLWKVGGRKNGRVVLKFNSGLDKGEDTGGDFITTRGTKKERRGEKNETSFEGGGGRWYR